jgi:hypothetical protein
MPSDALVLVSLQHVEDKASDSGNILLFTLHARLFATLAAYSGAAHLMTTDQVTSSRAR